MRLSTHLSFDGTCREAFGFYERVLGGSILTMLTYGESPMADQVPRGCGNRIIHATLKVGDFELMGVDALPGRFVQPGGFQVLLQPEDPDEARRVFDLFAEGGEVVLPLQKTFWSPCFGALVDRFGVPWEISCESHSGG